MFNQISKGKEPNGILGEWAFKQLERLLTFGLQCTVVTRVVDPYSFFTDPDPDPELDVGGQYGSGSNTDPGL
jgi:hypothetical protein